MVQSIAPRECTEGHGATHPTHLGDRENARGRGERVRENCRMGGASPAAPLLPPLCCTAPPHRTALPTALRPRCTPPPPPYRTLLSALPRPTPPRCRPVHCPAFTAPPLPPQQCNATSMDCLHCTAWQCSVWVGGGGSGGGYLCGVPSARCILVKSCRAGRGSRRSLLVVYRLKMRWSRSVGRICRWPSSSPGSESSLLALPPLPRAGGAGHAPLRRVHSHCAEAGWNPGNQWRVCEGSMTHATGRGEPLCPSPPGAYYASRQELPPSPAFQKGLQIA